MKTANNFNKVTAKLFFIFFLLIFVQQAKVANAQGWSALGAGIAGPGGVLGLTFYNQELYAGGLFNMAGGISVNNIAKWDGSAWDSLGSGMMNGSVFPLTVYNGELYAGGQFATAGGIPANNIARWNGSVWDSLESGTNNQVSTFEIYNGELYATGSFTFAGGIPADKIAKWNATSWAALPSVAGINSQGMAVYNNKLYISTANGYVKIWNGLVWDSIPSPIIGGINGMAVYNGELYVCGSSLIYVGNNPQIPVNMIAKWDGLAWSDVGGGLTICCNMIRQAHAMIVYNGELYVGGRFQFAGSVPASNIAKWNGSTWSPVCAGVNSGVRAFTIHNGVLYASGFFTTAGGISANRVAKYSPPFASITPASSTVCNGSSVTLNANTGDATSWQWYNNNSPIVGAVTSQLSVNAPGSYSVEITFPGQCPAATSTAVQVTEGTGPADVTISSTSTVGCEPNTIYTGYGAQSITLTANATEAVSYLWSTGETTQSISVSAAGTYSVTAYDAAGCASQQTPETEVIINVVDARCGNNNTKITLCHVPEGNTSNPQTICIGSPAVAAHLALHTGDCIGPCSSNIRVAIEEEENEITIYPNPARDELYIISYMLLEKGLISIYNLLGEELYKSEIRNPKSEINTSTLPNGIYFLQLKSNSQTRTQKFIISR